MRSGSLSALGATLVDRRQAARVEIYTIGVTHVTAEDFFGRLKRAGVRRILDIRLNNTSDVGAVAKASDLPYFLAELVGASYEHEPMLAPNETILGLYDKGAGEWSDYEREFRNPLAARHVEVVLEAPEFATPTALLCSEAGAAHCHWRLVCEYLAEHWPGLRAIHL
jgi:uncharacterized protein (DUF488 family)